MIKKIFIMFILLTGCSPSSIEDCRLEAKRVAQEMRNELEEVQTRTDLVKKKAILKKLYMRIAAAMVKAEGIEEAGIEEEEEFEGLREELARVYEIDGGKELMESYQLDALEYLQRPRP